MGRGRAVGEKHLGLGRIGTQERHPLRHVGREVYQGRGLMMSGGVNHRGSLTGELCDNSVFRSLSELGEGGS